MNNFDKVLFAVKEYCKDPNRDEINCFSYIADKADISEDKLFPYLDALRVLGLIKYSTKNKHIQLTAERFKREFTFH